MSLLEVQVCSIRQKRFYMIMNRLTRSTILLILFLWLPSVVYSQANYRSINSICYYPDSIASTNSYIKELCQLDIYQPLNIKGYATLVWFHGGGLTGGEKYLPTLLKDHGIAVVSVNYRLSPIVTAPSYIEDAAAAYAWVENHISEFGGDPSKVFIGGHSAGAYLSLMVGLDSIWLQKYNLNSHNIPGILSLSGQVVTHFTIRKERHLPENRIIVDEFAPLYYVEPNTPPLYLFVGDRDKELMNRYEENLYFYKRLQACGDKGVEFVEFTGKDHSSMEQAALPQVVQFIKDRSTVIDSAK